MSEHADTTPSSGDGFVRSVSRVDAEIRSILTLNLDAEQQLANVRTEQARHRREIEVLVEHELFVVGAMEGRKAKVDRLLEERLRSQASEQVSA